MPVNARIANVARRATSVLARAEYSLRALPPIVHIIIAAALKASARTTRKERDAPAAAAAAQVEIRTH